MKKRFVLFAIVAALLMCLFMSGVSADDFIDVSHDSQYSTAIYSVSAKGIMRGTTDTTFLPNADIQRYQLALFLARATTGEVADDTVWENGIVPFTDVTEYTGAIQYVFVNGIMKGRTETIFQPYANVTYIEALTVSLRALGYDGFEYPWGFYDKAVDLGLTNNMNVGDLNATLSRAETAQILYNMIHARRTNSDLTFAEDYFPITASGMCGDALTWTLYDDGELVISGTGAMWNWSTNSSFSPWYSYREQIKIVTISNSVTSIGERAFYNCDNLTSISIGDGVTSIGADAFYACVALTSVTIPESVTSIDSFAFRYCRNLMSVSIPDSVTSIGHNAFTGCTSLTSIEIPQGVTSIGLYVFLDCSSLTGITVDSDNAYYSNDENGVLYNKDKTELVLYLEGKTETEYIIPESVTSIREGAFHNCDNLTNIIIPDSVTSIGDNAFSSSDDLTCVTIPASVTSIGWLAFDHCSGLTSATIYSDNAVFSSNVFGNVAEGFTIHAHVGSTAEKYASANGHVFIPLGTDITENIIALMSAPATATVTTESGYWIEGENTFNVSCDNPCRVFVTSDGGVTYERLTATANANGGYDFTANLTAESEIIVRIAGDINGNGTLAENDYTRAKNIFLDQNYATDAINQALLDNNGDGRITVNEITLIRRILLGYTVAW